MPPPLEQTPGRLLSHALERPGLMARYVLFATLLLSSAGGLHCLPAHQQSHRRLYTLRAPGLTHCHHLVHFVCCLDHMAWHTRPDSCSPISFDRLRCTAVIAADDVDRTDLSDPALNADLDKPKTLLPHSDVEPSSMMLQPVGESEPIRKNSAAV